MFLQAAVTGSTILAIVIGAVIVGNTMLLSLFERTREFGLLRAIGWTRSPCGCARRRRGNRARPDRRRASGSGSPSPPRTCSNACRSSTGVLHANYTQEAFWRGLYTGLGMAVIGALYPALRAANLKPLKALSRE